MPPVLSPAESLGLAGASLDGRVRRAANSVSDATYARLSEQLRGDAFANGMIYEREGEQEAVRIMLRPLVAMREQLSYVHHVCLQLNEALKRLPSLYLADERIRRIVAISPEEERWLKDTWTKKHERFNPIYGRLDAVCDFSAAGWQDSLHFMEPNLSGVGGIHYAPLAEQLVMRDVVPTIVSHDPDLAMELPRDQRDLFAQVLIDHARDIERASCRLGFVEPKYVADGPAEQGVLSEYLSRHLNLQIAHADPRELYVKGDEVYYEDTCIDVVYRDYELRELAELEREIGKPLDAMRLMFRQNRVVSSIVGDFDHKSCWEILTDPTIAESLYGVDDCRLFRRHVLWTRVVAERKTTLPHEGEGDLVDYIRHHREELVLKPNRSYGGTGVLIGASTEEGEWEKALHQAVLDADDPERSVVVQSATRLPVYTFPVVGADGRVFGEPFYSVMGFAATDNGLGILCRVSQKQVVNVAQRGGLAAILVTDRPLELRIPKRSMGRDEGVEKALRAQIGELQHLDHALALLGWDEETMLPASAREERGEQTATLEGYRHALLVSDSLGDMIEEVALQHEGDERWLRELALLRRARRHALALPESLVRRFANLKSRALGAWENARERGEYSLFADPFEELLPLLRERAQAFAKGGNVYDALLDEYEPGMTQALLDPILTEMRTRLVPIVRAASPAASKLKTRKFADAGQWELCRRILTAIGFDFGRGRLDRSTHPFTLFAGFNDVRLTTRIREDDLPTAVLATLHEGGHGLYDQGFDPADKGWLLADGPSMGLHESQSRLWENHVGRSRAFWDFIFPSIRELFPDAAKGLDADDFHRAVNLVCPSVNRVEADEVSYHLHILLRYELEIALLTGALAIGDLPTAWNEKCLSLLGVKPKNDRDGVLQDVHWSLGMFGYFPTYTLGSLYAAQQAEAYGRDHALEDEIRKGDFKGLLAWLRENIHKLGQRYTAEEIVTRATGKVLGASAFFRRVEAIRST